MNATLIQFAMRPEVISGNDMPTRKWYPKETQDFGILPD